MEEEDIGVVGAVHGDCVFEERAAGACEERDRVNRDCVVRADGCLAEDGVCDG